jgi:hypothetical protein
MLGHTLSIKKNLCQEFSEKKNNTSENYGKPLKDKDKAK